MRPQGPLHGRVPSTWLFPGGCIVNFLRFLLRDLPTAEDLTIFDNFQLPFNPIGSPPMTPAFQGLFSGNPPSYVEGEKDGLRQSSSCPLDLQEVDTPLSWHLKEQFAPQILSSCLTLSLKLCFPTERALGRHRTNQQGFCLIRWPPGNVVPVFPACKRSQYLWVIFLESASIFHRFPV